MAVSRVLILYTGGTIGMVPVDPDDPDGTRRPGSKDDVLRYVPGIGLRDGIEWELLSDASLPPIDSSGITPVEWLKIAGIIRREYQAWDGFVILHGTDTMAYTASALSFLFENLGKPVVLTGSQTPLFHERTDGRLNLIHSLRIAGHRATGLPPLPEVVICFGKRVVRGNRARKMSATDSDAFDSPNLRPLGAIETDVFLDRSLLLPVPAASFHTHSAMSNGVVDITIVPGLPPSTLEILLAGPAIQGAILRTFGQGNFPPNPELLAVISRAADRGTILLNVTQCPRGAVNMNQYEAGRILADRGVVSAGDMTPEAAYTKLSWLLATFPSTARNLVSRNLRGELSPP
ncbi:MAG: asparaginase [Bryobacterales bacterium]|nr:asparaginase [Bryobacterales bacterium]